jgi:WD40 repeat protein
MIELELVKVLEGHEHPVYALSNSQKEHIIFSGGGEAAVVEWSLKTMSPIKVMYKSPGSIYYLHSPIEFPYLISGDRAGVLTIFDFISQKIIHQKQISKSAIFNIKNIQHNLFIATEEGSLISFDLNNLSKTAELKLSNLSLRTISINNNHLYVAGKDLLIHQVKLDDFSIEKQWQAHEMPVFSSVYDRINQQLITGARDAQIKFWFTENNNNLAAHYFAVNDLQISNDDRYLISASMDKTIKVWDLESRNLVAIADAQKNMGHTKSVNRLAISKFEDYIVSASDDKNLMVWKIKQS